LPKSGDIATKIRGQAMKVTILGGNSNVCNTMVGDYLNQ